MGKLKLLTSRNNIIVLSVVLSIAGYNIWAYCCGYCVMNDFFRISLPSQIIIGLNICALSVLGILVLKKRVHARKFMCPCGRDLNGEVWGFCPECGKRTSTN
jgi:hypothetical protein